MVSKETRFTTVVTEVGQIAEKSQEVATMNCKRLFSALALVVVIATMCFNSTIAVALPPTGLVAWWQGEGDASDSAGPYNGTLVGGVTFAPGKVGQAFHLDGVNDYVDFGTALNFPSWANYAVTAWFRQEGGGDSGGYGQKIIDKTVFFHDFHISIVNTPTHPLHGNLRLTTYEGGAGEIWDQSYNYIDNAWHHVVVNKSGSYGELWIDGVLKGTSNDIKTVFSNGNLLLGYSLSPDSFQQMHFNGLIDDVGIYNRPLTAAEIQEISSGVTNQPPVANDDLASMDEDTAVTVDVAANDTDDDGNLDLTSVTVTSSPSNGSVLVNPLTGEITYTPDPGFNGTDSFEYQICDTDGLCDVATVTVTVLPVNDSPVVTADLSTVVADEGQTANNSGAVSDVDGDSVTLSASVGTVINNGNGTWSWSFTTSDGPTESQEVVIAADDGNGGLSQTTFNLTVNNLAPTVGTITAAVDPVAINTVVNASADFTDPGTADTHTGVWSWGDSSTSPATISETSGSGSATASHTYTTAGVYTVTLTLTDDDGGSDESTFQFVVVYDPSAGFVTGGGWINSPLGAYTPANPNDEDITGKANFGFVAKYKKGQSTPDGNTQFQFNAAGLNFSSVAYQWLVVAGAHAKYKGDGTVNGSGNYGFMLTATDGALNGGGGDDLFRIKIWDKDNADAVLYDNQPGDGDDADATFAIGGGSITIHTSGNGQNAAPALSVIPESTGVDQNYPNPFNPETWIPYQLAAEASVSLTIYDSVGTRVRTIHLGHQSAGMYQSRNRAIYWDGKNDAGERVSSGLYFYQLQAGEYSAVRKMVIVK